MIIQTKKSDTEFSLQNSENLKVIIRKYIKINDVYDGSWIRAHSEVDPGNLLADENAIGMEERK